MVEKEPKFSKKIEPLKKLLKNPQKIQRCICRRADSKNIACLESRGHILKIFGLKFVTKCFQLPFFDWRFRKNNRSDRRNEAEINFWKSKSTKNLHLWVIFENGRKMLQIFMRNWKIDLLYKLPTNAQKIQRCRSRRAESINIVTTYYSPGATFWKYSTWN